VRDRFAEAFLADRRVAVRLLHAGDHHARVRRTRPRSRPRSRPTSAGAGWRTVYGALAPRPQARWRVAERAGASRRARAGASAGALASHAADVISAAERSGPGSKARWRRRCADVPLGGARSPTTRACGALESPSPGSTAADASTPQGCGGRRPVARGAAPPPRQVQGRRTTVEEVRRSGRSSARAHDGGVRLATSWVEPAYLEPDASWCAGWRARSPYENGGAFGGKLHSARPPPALADQLGATVRRLFARGRRAARPEAAADGRDRGVHADGVRSIGVVARRDHRVRSRWPSPSRSKSMRTGGGRRAPDRPSASARRRAVSPNGRCSSKRRARRQVSIAPR
jgi:hypothetical protein